MITREVKFEADDGKALTAHELMVACSSVPGDIVPTFKFNWNGTIKAIIFKIQFVPEDPTVDG